MILHIFNDQKKFSKEFFKVLYDNSFNLREHELFHYGKKDEYFEKIGVKTTFLKSWFLPFGHLKLLRELKRSDKVMIHCLASPMLLLILFFYPNICNKCIWSIWGKDLYFYHTCKKRTIFHMIYELFRKKVIKNMGTVVTMFKEEGDILKEWYNIEDKRIFYGFIYISGSDMSDEVKKEKSIREKKVLLLGNSASITNNHIDALNKLKSCYDKIENIYCPLSYGGSKKYAKSVGEKGKKLFGNKFIPIYNFMPKDKYFAMMEDIDVGIFNNNRQEALGNIGTMISKHKTLYMQKDISTSKYFRRIGIKVKYIEDIKNEIEEFDYETLKHNKEVYLNNVKLDDTINLLHKILD